MILDSHVHIRTGDTAPAMLIERLQSAGVDGAALISRPPSAYREQPPGETWRDRLRQLLEWCPPGSNLYPLYWLDPTEPNAIEQIEEAARIGALGIKIICDRFYPGDSRAMTAYAAIARLEFPVLFHSGILWDGKPSSRYNRPAEFEALLAVPGLRFCLAHISWPWCDESVAVYGKFLNALPAPGASEIEMFIDTTPGTPPIYRRDALKKLYATGYDVAHNTMFGSDCSAHDYNVTWTREWMDRDRRILRRIGISEENQTLLFGGNLRRFLRLDRSRPVRRSPRPGE